MIVAPSAAIAAGGSQVLDRRDAAVAPDARAARAVAVVRPSVPGVAAAVQIAVVDVQAYLVLVLASEVYPAAGSDSRSALAVPSAVVLVAARASDVAVVQAAPGRSLDLRRADGSSAATRVPSAAASPAAVRAEPAWARRMVLAPVARPAWAEQEQSAPRPRDRAPVSRQRARVLRPPAAVVAVARRRPALRRPRPAPGRLQVQGRRGRPRVAAE